MNGVIYARYSCENQREESIEGQLRECREFAKRKGIDIVGEYIDRAKSARNDKRPDFQRMLKDSYSKTFEAVIVWKFDRFARNRGDSIKNKTILRQNGVKLISATEPIIDGSLGIIMESIIDGYSEFYSADLAEKVNRGMKENALKCKSNGGVVPFGYRLNENKQLEIDEFAANIVKEIFERYAQSEPITDIINDLKNRGIKTARGSTIDKSVIYRMLRNKKYLGIYVFDDVEIKDGIPRIISDELFGSVQKVLVKNGKHRASNATDEPFLLTTKLFCGVCREMMIGYSGTSKNSSVYRYYICKNARKHKCDKKAVNKDLIEDKVIQVISDFLTDKKSERIIKGILKECKHEYENSETARLKTEIKKREKAISNLLDSIELGEQVPALLKRIEERKKEIEELERQLAKEQLSEFVLDEDTIRRFFFELKNKAKKEPRNRRVLINIFVNKVFVYDNKLIIYFNGSHNETELTEVFLTETEKKLSGNNAESDCSSDTPSGSPKLSQK